MASTKSTITIEGMHCNSCVMLLTDVLSDIEGVEQADVSMGKAVVVHDPHKARIDALKKAIEAEGYKAQ